MPIPILPILQALAPLLANAGGIAASLRAPRGSVNNEDRLQALETEALRAGEVLAGITKQLQAVAEVVRVQAELNEARERKAKAALGAALVALGMALATLAWVALA